MSVTTELRFLASRSAGEVSAILDRPEDARWILVLGHGAGAGMRHPFMKQFATALNARDVATFRYQFPYMENRAGRPDPPPILYSTVQSAVASARTAAPGLPLLAGGKSFGGRMTSNAFAHAPDAFPDLRGIVFVGFPLHMAGAEQIARADHLDQVALPMLFLQGTRDKMANLDLLGTVLGRLGSRATLHVVEGADHSFSMLKRSGRTNAEVLEELADTVVSWGERWMAPHASASPE